MTPMSEGIDYLFTHKFVEGTINTGVPVYGSITLLDKKLLRFIDIGLSNSRWRMDIK